MASEASPFLELTFSLTLQESKEILRNSHTVDQRVMAVNELGELDAEGDEEDEIVLEASNPRQSNRPQGWRSSYKYTWGATVCWFTPRTD